MESIEKMNLGTDIQKLKTIHAELEKDLKHQERALRLMDAGLKELPLERDFVELLRFRLESDQTKFDLATILLEAMKKIQN